MAVSVVEPIVPAIERTKGLFFQPFDFRKWLLLGFCVFLVQLPQTFDVILDQIRGIVQQIVMMSRPPGGAGPAPEEAAFDWVKANLPTFIAIAAGVILAYTVVKLLCVWASSRGHFILLDNLVRNQSAIRGPWRDYAQEGNSLFGLRIVLGLIVLLVFTAIGAVCVTIAWPDVSTGQFGPYLQSAFWIGILLALLVSLPLYVVNVLLYNVVVPIMYLRNLTVMAALREFSQTMLPGRVGVFALYVVFKFIIDLAIASIVMAITCATCCIAAIPYVSSVVFAPLLAFERCYCVSFIEQFGPEWQAYYDDDVALDDLPGDGFAEDKYPDWILQKGNVPLSGAS